jgi:hypothetical protein
LRSSVSGSKVEERRPCILFYSFSSLYAEEICRGREEKQAWLLMFSLFSSLSFVNQGAKQVLLMSTTFTNCPFKQQLKVRNIWEPAKYRIKKETVEIQQQIKINCTDINKSSLKCFFDQ